MAHQPLPPYIRINKEDLGKNVPDWVDGLLSPLNLNFQANYSLFNKGINEVINIDSMIEPITFRTLPTYAEGDPSTFQPLTFQSTLTGVPECYYVGNIININNSSYVFSKPVWASCSFNNGVISVDFVTGLAPSTSYSLVLKVS
jgi:hypothetical protein